MTRPSLRPSATRHQHSSVTLKTVIINFQKDLSSVLIWDIKLFLQYIRHKLMECDRKAKTRHINYIEPMELLIHEVFNSFTFGRNKKMSGKFLPGSCENCGSADHKKRDCLERPRKIPAKYSGSIAKPSDSSSSAAEKLAFDAKRDRWMGYSGESYDKKLEEYSKKEDLDALSQIAKVPAPASPSKPSDKSFGGDMTTVTNLRVREDTAKYLLNLDVDSAYYDPKSRAMRDDPNAKASGFKGDNFVRFTGDTEEAIKARAFAWESKDGEIHEMANPTATLKKLKEADAAKKAEMSITQKDILDKYA